MPSNRSSHANRHRRILPCKAKIGLPPPGAIGWSPDGPIFFDLDVTYTLIPPTNLHVEVEAEFTHVGPNRFRYLAIYEGDLLEITLTVSEATGQWNILVSYALDPTPATWYFDGTNFTPDTLFEYEGSEADPVSGPATVGNITWWWET